MVAGYLIFHSSRGPWTLQILTGPDGLTFHSLGEQLSWSLTELPANPIREAPHIPTSGSADNLDRLLNAGSKTNFIAFVSRAVLSERIASDPTGAKEVKVLARLYRDVLQVVVRTNVNRLEALEGRPVCLAVTMQ